MFCRVMVIWRSGWSGSRPLCPSLPTSSPRYTLPSSIPRGSGRSPGRSRSTLGTDTGSGMSRQSSPPEDDVSDKLGLSVVVPCFNEADNMLPLHDRLSKACQGAVGGDYEIVYVNDGSRDATWARIHGIMQEDSHVVAVNLSRNFGHQIAVTAGLEHSRGGSVFIIDADLQDPPELLGPMLTKMAESGADVVYGQRIKRRGESAFKQITAAAFYR